MKTVTLPSDDLIVKIEEPNIELNEKTVRLIVKESNTENSEIAFHGYSIGKYKIALLQYMHCKAQPMARKLITQATMIAWELGYDLFLSKNDNGVILECGFYPMNKSSQPFYATELSWNAFEKISPSDLNTFLSNLNEPAINPIIPLPTEKE